MAGKSLLRLFVHSPRSSPSSSSSSRNLNHRLNPESNSITSHLFGQTLIRLYSSTSRRKIRTDTVSSAAAKTNFSLPDSESDSDTEVIEPKNVDKPKLPPPYDPFSKKPAFDDPKDPKNLQEIFHGMRGGGDGLMNSAVKMLDGLSKDGLTHEALEIFSQIKDGGGMPDVVAFTAVIEAYANAGGQAKAALKAFLRMQASGTMPNAYTYSVLIRGLVGDGRVEEARKYVVEMAGKGMRPNAATYVGVVEAFVSAGREEEGRGLVEEMTAKGFGPEAKGVEEAMKGRRGGVMRTVADILVGK